MPDTPEEVKAAIDTQANSEAVEAEVSETVAIVPDDISLMKTADDLQSGVALVLENYERTREHVKGCRGIDEIWKQVLAVNDNNEKVLMMMNQGFVLFQDAHDRYFKELADDEKAVNVMEKEALRAFGAGEEDGKEKMKEVTKEKRRIANKTMDAQKNLRAFMECSVKMAHEYRQCRTEQQFYFHVSQFQQFFALLIAVLHQEITQANILDRISKKLTEASLKIFPVGVAQNDR